LLVHLAILFTMFIDHRYVPGKFMQSNIILYGITANLTGIARAPRKVPSPNKHILNCRLESWNQSLKAKAAATLYFTASYRAGSSETAADQQQQLPRRQSLLCHHSFKVLYQNNVLHYFFVKFS